MSGTGPAPSLQRRRRNAPSRGDWQASDATGWQHGATPDAPAGLRPESRAAWTAWMAGWPAAHWIPADLPALQVVARLYDELAAGRFQRAGELRMWMDTYGMTPKGQQDRRWLAPAAPQNPTDASLGGIDRYRHLRPLSERYTTHD